MKLERAYLCEECHELQEWCPKGKCDICGSETVIAIESFVTIHPLIQRLLAIKEKKAKLEKMREVRLIS